MHKKHSKIYLVKRTWCPIKQTNGRSYNDEKIQKNSSCCSGSMMAFSVTGCGGGAKETTAAAAADTTAAGSEAEKVSEAVTEAAKEEGKKIEDMTVGVFYYTYSDTYISSVRTALDESLKAAGIDSRIMMQTAIRLHRMSRSILRSAPVPIF